MKQEIVKLKSLLLFTIVVLSCNTTNSIDEPELSKVKGRVFWIQNEDTINVVEATVRIGNIDTVTSGAGEFEIEIEKGFYRIQVFSESNDFHRFFSDSILLQNDEEVLQINSRSKYIDMLPLLAGQIFEYDFYEESLQNPNIKRLVRKGILKVEVTNVIVENDIKLYELSENLSYTQIIEPRDSTDNDTTYHININGAICTLEEELALGRYDKALIVKFSEPRSKFCQALRPNTISEDGKILQNAFQKKYINYSDLNDNQRKYSDFGNMYSWDQTFEFGTGMIRYYQSNNIDYILKLTLLEKEQ